MRFFIRHTFAIVGLLGMLALLGSSSSSDAVQDAASGSAPAYDLTLDIAPERHLVTIEGTVAIPVGERRAQLEFTIARSAGPIEWRDGATGVLIPQARRVQTAAGPATWTIPGPFAAGQSVVLRFRYSIVTPEPEGFLYVGPEVSFGSGNWYPDLGEAKPLGRLLIRSRAEGIVAAGGRPGQSVRSERHVSQAFHSTVQGDLFFALTPASGHSTALTPSLTLTTLRGRTHEAAWRTGLIGVREALETEFGSLPYEHVFVIEVPDDIAAKAGFGAFASTGAVFARSSFMDQPFNVPAFAHEFAHLWWGNHIQLAGTQGDFLLDEGLAQYGSIAAVDRVLGAEAGARYRREGMPGFNESLFSALGYLKIEAAGRDRPLLQLGNDGLSYWITYSKAGLVWYALAEEMGRDNFRRALAGIANRHGAGTISWPQFVAALDRHSDHSLQPFIAAWFSAAGAPEYRLQWRQGRGYVVGRISQVGAPRPAVLELELTAADGTKSRHRIGASGRSTGFRIAAPNRIASVALDPDYKILRWTPDLSREARTMAASMRASALSRLGNAAEAEQAFGAVLRHAPLDNRYDRLLLARATLVRLSEARNCPACAVVHLRAALDITPERLDRLGLTYLALALAARRLDQPVLARRAAMLGRSADALVGDANGVAIKLAQAPSA